LVKRSVLSLEFSVDTDVLGIERLPELSSPKDYYDSFKSFSEFAQLNINRLELHVAKAFLHHRSTRQDFWLELWTAVGRASFGNSSFPCLVEYARLCVDHLPRGLRSILKDGMGVALLVSLENTNMRLEFGRVLFGRGQ
jgi:hypothetical protein